MPRGVRTALLLTGLSLALLAVVLVFTDVFAGECIGETSGTSCTGFGEEHDWLADHTLAALGGCFIATTLVWTYVRLVRRGHRPDWL